MNGDWTLTETLTGSLPPDAILSALLDAIPDVVWVIEVGGTVLYANDGAAAMFGAAEPEVPTGRDFFDLIPPALLDICRSNSAAALAGRTVRFELETDERIFECAFSPILTQGVASGLVLHGKDVTAFRHTDVELRRQQQRLIYLMEQLPGFLILVDDQYVIQYANRFFRKRFRGHKGQRCFEVLHHRDAPCPGCPSAPSFAAQTPCEWEWTHEDGRTYQINSHPMTETDGSLRVILHGMDITARKQAEQALRRAHDELELRVQQRTAELRESETRFRAVVEDQTELIGRLSANRLLYFVNGAYLRFFQSPREALIGTPFLSQIFPEDRSALEVAFDPASAEDPVRTLECRVTRAPGDVRWLRWIIRALYDDAGSLVEYQAVGEDVTTLRQAETRYFTLLQGLPTVVFGLTREFRVDFINNTCLTMLGYSPEEALSRPDWLIAGMHPEDQAAVLAAFDGFFASPEQGFSLVFRFKHKRGYLVHLQAKSLPPADLAPAAERQRLEGVLMDVTERAFLDKVLVQKEKLNTLGAISAELAHEIRNPLMAMGGFARRLMSRHPELDEAGIILEQAQRLEQLLGRITRYLEPVAVRRQECEINAILTFCLELLGPGLVSRSLDVVSGLDDSIGPFQSDPDILTQVFVSLITKAASTVQPGGKMTVRSFETREHVGVVFLVAPLHYRVRDPEKLFLPFDSDEESFNLAVSYQQVKNIGGYLTFRQDVASATYTVLLAKRVEGEAPAAATPQALV